MQLKLFIIFLLIWSFPSCASETKSQEPKTPSLLLISIDGCRPADLSSQHSPELMSWALEGQQSEGLIPIFPSLTFPNHVSIVTGKSAEQHGIVANDMKDPAIEYEFNLGNQRAMTDARWWKDAEPLWITAEKNGKKAATLFWPGSESEYGGRRQSYWLPFNKKMTPIERVDKVVEWLRLPVAQRPQFATLYFDTVDGAGHNSGPGSIAVQAALKEVDQALKHLREELEASGLWKSLNVVVVSDHGMVKTEASKIIFLSEIFQPGEVDVIGAGGMFGVNLEKINATQFFSRLPKDFPFECQMKEKLPKEFEYSKNTRIPQIVCYAYSAAYAAKARRSVSQGTHGYDSRNPEMNGIFLARGPQFPKSKKTSPFPNRRIHGMVLQALEISNTKGDN